MKRCLIVNGEWGIIESWSSAFARAFYELGYQADIVVTFKELLDAVASSLASGGESAYAFILTFSGYLLEEAAKSGFSFDAVGIPLVAFYVDHPENTSDRIFLSPANSFSGLFDRSDITLARKYIRSKTRYFFLTDAGLECPGPIPTFDERDIDVLFCGTIPDFESMRKNILAFNRPNLSKLFDELVELLLENERISVVDAYEQLAGCTDFTFETGNQAFALAFAVITLASHYVRGLRRVRLFDALRHAGFQISCVGDPMHFEPVMGPNITVLGPAYGEEYLKLVSRAKVTLNSSPLSQYALSERQPTSMLCGAATVTDMNPFMDLYYKDGRDLIAYSHLDYSPLPDRINEVLSSRARWEEMTRNGYDVTYANHRFIHRAVDILDVLQSGF